MIMKKNIGKTKYIWDYDLKKADLSKPAVKVWYLSRKLQFGDFSGIRKADLKKYLSKLDLDWSIKQLIRNYLRKNG